MDKARDDRWQETVKKEYDGECPHCGEEGVGHHIVGRDVRKLRYVKENGIYCCDILHDIFAGEQGEDLKELMIHVYIGEERALNLQKIKNNVLTVKQVEYKEIK